MLYNSGKIWVIAQSLIKAVLMSMDPLNNLTGDILSQRMSDHLVFLKASPVVIYYASFLEKNILLVISVDYIFSKVLK